MTIASPTADAVQPPSLTETINSEESVEVDCQELIVGRTLIRPIYSLQGTLLLAERMTITPEFKRLLRERQIGRVRLHPDDGMQETAQARPRAAGDDVHFDDALTARLDEIIDSGLLFVVNSESAVSSGVQAARVQEL